MEFEWNEYYLLIRFIACFLLGFWWCSSGVMLQWVTQNPLACPVSLGLTAAPISIWMIFFLIGIEINSTEAILKLTGTCLVLHFLLYLLVGKIFNVKNIKVSLSKNSIVLFGIGLNLSLAALYSFFHFYFSARGQALPSSLWFGLLKIMDFEKFTILVGLSILFLIPLNSLLNELNLISLGREIASNVINIDLLEKKVVIFLSLVLCCLVFLGGVFAFWGLILPHLIRQIPYVSRAIGREMYLGGAISGLFLAFLDYLCFEYPIGGAELPVGVISSILGPLFLVYLLVRKSLKTSN